MDKRHTGHNLQDICKLQAASPRFLLAKDVGKTALKMRGERLVEVVLAPKRELNDLCKTTLPLTMAVSQKMADIDRRRIFSFCFPSSTAVCARSLSICCLASAGSH